MPWCRLRNVLRPGGVSGSAVRFSGLGAKYIFRGQDFINFLFETNNSGHNKIWGTATEFPIVAAGLGVRCPMSSETKRKVSCDFLSLPWLLPSTAMANVQV